MKIHPSHKKNLDALKRIEGQVRGIQKMIEKKRYCVDILTQLSSVTGAISRVQQDVLERHLQGCVKTSLEGKSEAEKKKKVSEILTLLKSFKKLN